MKRFLSSRKQLSVLIILAVTLVCFASVKYGNSDDLLIFVEAGSANAVKAVRSGKGQVTVINQKFQADVMVRESRITYDLVFSGGNHYASATTTLKSIAALPGLDQKLPATGTKNSILLQISDGKSIVLSQQRTNKARISWAGGPLPADDDIRMYLSNVGLKSDSLPGHGLIDIGQLKFDPDSDVTHKSKAIVGEEVIDGSLCKIIEFNQLYSTSGTTLTYRIWVDPGKGFTVPRMRVIGNGGRYKTSTIVVEENVQLKEYCPGIWYPEKAIEEKWRVGNDGQRVKYSVTTITYDPGFKLNIPVTSEDLELNLPTGTRVHDDIVDADYVVQ